MKSRITKNSVITSCNEITVFCCGYTPRNPLNPHTARPFFTARTIANFLATSGFKVNYVEGIADTDPRLNRKNTDLMIVQFKTIMNQIMPLHTKCILYSPLYSSLVNRAYAFLNTIPIFLRKNVIYLKSKNIESNNLDTNFNNREMCNLGLKETEYCVDAFPIAEIIHGTLCINDAFACAIALDMYSSQMTVHVSTKEVLPHNLMVQSILSYQKHQIQRIMWLHVGTVVDVNGIRLSWRLNNSSSLSDFISLLGINQVRNFFLKLPFTEDLSMPSV